jgi:hypothetical protein
MSQYSAFNLQLNFSPPIHDSVAANVVLSPIPLMKLGFNIPVTIATPSARRVPPISEPLKSITITAHFDTGASSTSIDERLAVHLGLAPAGVAQHYTASGCADTTIYVADIHFPGTALNSFTNLQINSCKLPFEFTPEGADFLHPSNMGMLIGRDIMAKWNIVWNGPTSSVLISD